jgi:hypothetical protein
MRKFLLLIIFNVTFIAINYAQTAVVTRRELTPSAAFKPIAPADENTIVKDSSGNVLAYKQWHPLFLTGDYSIKSSQQGNAKPVYVLHKLTAAEK